MSNDDEQLVLVLRYRRTGDLAAREQLVERLMPLVRKLAMRYRGGDEPLDDLIQVAAVGLLKAIDRFEPGRGNRLATYAVPTILGELKRHFRDEAWSVHVPRDLQSRALAVGTATEALTKRLGRSPTVREVGAELGVTNEEVLEAGEAARGYGAISLDAAAARDGEEGNSLVDALGSEDPGYTLVESRDAIATTWRALPRIERQVLRLRFADDLTQREIGERIGFSQMQVSRLLRHALARLEAAGRPA